MRNKYSVPKKRIKQILIISLCLSIIFVSTSQRYAEIKTVHAVGIPGALIAGGALCTPMTGVLICTAVIGGIVLITAPTINEDYPQMIRSIEKNGKQVYEDFCNYSLQAVQNNVNAAEMEKAGGARVRETIDDFLETFSNGFVDTTSEAWDWFRNFCSDIRGAVGASGTTEGGMMPMTDGYPRICDGKCLIGTRTLTGTIACYYLVLEGVDLGDATGCIIARNKDRAGMLSVYSYLTGKLVDISIKAVKTLRVDRDAKTGKILHEYSAVKAGAVANSSSIIDVSGMVNDYDIPIFRDGITAPIEVTDVPGVSRPQDYQVLDRDLPVRQPDGAYDICDPVGKKGQVEWGLDLPQDMGYEDWYDWIGNIYNGDSTWEEVANASDVITIGSDTADTFYPSDNASEWEAYINLGQVVSIDVDENGNMTITLTDGRVIPIPAEYAGDVAITADGVTYPVEGTGSIPVPAQGVISIPLVILMDIPVPPSGGGDGHIPTIDSKDGPYTLDFRKLFPFCIPYDVYHFVQVLDATPQAPVIHYKFRVDKKHIYTIHINLNKFNSVAEILRKMEVLLFIVGLAAATRRIYIRG